MLQCAIAIQLAKAMGATVIAAASSAEKRQTCINQGGADYAIDYTPGGTGKSCTSLLQFVMRCLLQCFSCICQRIHSVSALQCNAWRCDRSVALVVILALLLTCTGAVSAGRIAY
jgi:threonine dehydrogenase-like Zn-dependent dehydrogenase